MFGDILALLKEHGRLSLRELAALLGSDPQAVEPMMDILVKKGKAELIAFGCSRGTCSGCSCASREDAMIYRLP